MPDYTLESSKKELVSLLPYIDDILLACKSLTGLQLLKEMLKGDFKMKDLGRAKKMLDMKIYRDRDKEVLTISQKMIH